MRLRIGKVEAKVGFRRATRVRYSAETDALRKDPTARETTIGTKRTGIHIFRIRKEGE